jgi:hypothetical protein
MRPSRRCRRSGARKLGIPVGRKVAAFLMLAVLGGGFAGTAPATLPSRCCAASRPWTKVVDNDVSRLESLDGQALVMQTAPSPADRVVRFPGSNAVNEQEAAYRGLAIRRSEVDALIGRMRPAAGG